MAKHTGRSNLVDLELDLKHETENAILVSDGRVEAWLPKSVIEYEIEPGSLTSVTVTMPEHFALEKGLL